MADKNALGVIGLMLGTVTALVMTVAAIVVNDHVSGRIQMDSGVSAVAQPSSVR